MDVRQAFDCTALYGVFERPCRISRVGLAEIRLVIDEWRQDLAECDSHEVDQSVGPILHWPWAELSTDINVLVGCLSLLNPAKKHLGLGALDLISESEKGSPAVAFTYLAKGPNAYEPRIMVTRPFFEWARAVSHAVNGTGLVVLQDVVNEKLVRYYEPFGFHLVAGPNEKGFYTMESDEDHG